jgi:hypothetical protein
MVRPEELHLARVEGDDVTGPTVTARVLRCTFNGPDQIVLLRLPGGREVRSRTLGTDAWEPGSEARISVRGAVRVIPASAPA